MGTFQDDYSIGNYSLFFFLVNSFKSVLPLQQAGIPYITITLFKKCHGFVFVDFCVLGMFLLFFWLFDPFWDVFFTYLVLE